MRTRAIAVLLLMFASVELSAKTYSYMAVSGVKYSFEGKTFSSSESLITIDDRQGLIFIGHTFSSYMGCDKKGGLPL